MPVGQPDIYTGSEVSRLIRNVYNDGQERAGIFVMQAAATGRAADATAGAPVFGPEAKILIEIAVWRTTRDRRQRVLWFTAKKEMLSSVINTIRAIEVWKNRNNGYPSKIVFLRK